MAKGTKGEGKAKKAGTSTTSTIPGDNKAVSLPQTSSVRTTNPRTSSPGNPRKTPSPQQKAAASSTSESRSSVLQVAPPLLGVLQSPTLQAMTALTISVGEGSEGKTTRKTSSPGKSAMSPKSTPRKTPSPGRPKAVVSPKLQTELHVDTDVIVIGGKQGRKTPSPNVGRKTPSPGTSRKTPSPGTRKTTSPGSKKTQSPSVSPRTLSPNVGRKTPSPNVNRKTPSPNTNRKTTSPTTSRKTPSPKTGSAQNQPETSGTFAIPKPAVSPRAAVASTSKVTSPKAKSPAAKDTKSAKPKSKKSAGAKAKTAAKSAKDDKRLKRIKMLKSKKSKAGVKKVTTAIKKKTLQAKKKLKVVIGLHAKHVKSAKVKKTSPVKKSPPKPKSPVQATTPRTPSPKAIIATASPKKLTPPLTPTGKQRPRIDDIAKRLSIENRERKEASGKESPGVKEAGKNGAKGENRRNSKEKGVSRSSTPKGSSIEVLPHCSWKWEGEPTERPNNPLVSVLTVIL